MQNVRRIRIGLVACLVASGLALPAASVGAQSETARSIPRPDAGLTGSDDIATATPDAPSQPRLEAALRSRGAAAPTQAVTVEVVGSDADIAAAVHAAGGTLGRGGGGLFLATVTGSKLAALAEHTGVSAVRTPVTSVQQQSERPLRTESGAVTAPGAANLVQWHAAGLKGEGAKVGVIGLFDTTVLGNESASGELPVVPTNARTCISAGAACPFGTPGQTWGNSLAEIVYDGAPKASFYLAELGYRSDYYNVIDWFAANGVTMVINPMMWTLDGPGNGTGPSAAIVDYAVSKGIAWFNMAGDIGQNQTYPTYQGGYWRGVWSDPNNNRYLNFKGTDESLSTYCGFLMGVRWSDWGLAKSDYDVYISDYNPRTKVNGTKKLLSGADQNAPGAQPLEATNGVRLCNTNAAYGPVYDTNKDGFVSLWIQRKTTSPAAASAGDVIEVAAYFGWMEYSSGAGSVSVPFADSANPGMATVGGSSPWFNDATPGNSRGPTNDGRPKPDFVSYNCNDTAVDGHPDVNCATGYYGSDGATASAVGYAAVVQQALHITTPQGLIRYLRDNAMWMGDESQYGAGAVRLPYYVPPTSYPASAFVPLAVPQRVLDTRPANPIGVPAAGPLKAGQTFSLSASWPGAVAVLNVAVVRATAPGYLSVYPHGYTWPGATSSLNLDAGQTRANLVVVPIGEGSHIDFFTSGGGDVIADLIGFMNPDRSDGYVFAGQGAGRFTPIQPVRVLNSRTCVGPPCAAYAAGAFIDVPLHGVANPADPTTAVPADAPAVALSVTIDSPAAAGYLSVIPGDQTTTPTSNLNYDAGQSLTTTVFASVPASGVARIYLQRSAHVQVDVLGWFSAVTGVAEPAGMFVPMNPTRAIDTRDPLNKAVGGVPVVVNAAARGVPTSAFAVLANNVGVQPEAPGTVIASASTPTVDDVFSNLTMPVAGKNVAAATVSKLSSGSFRLTPSVNTHLVSDLSGYFQGYSMPPLPSGQIVRTPNSIDTQFGYTDWPLAVSDDGATATFQESTGHSTMIWHRSTNTASLIDPSWYGRHVLTPDGSTVFITVSNYSTLNSSDLLAIDLATNAIEKISVDSNEQTVAGGHVWSAAPSADGHLVAFSTEVALDPGDTNTTSPDVYLRNRTTGTTTLVGPAPYTARLSMSADGSKIAWMRDGVAPGSREVVVHNVAGGTTVVFPTTATSSVVQLLGDGSKILLARETPPGWGLFELSFMNTSTGASQVVALPAWLTPSQASVSADGNTILAIGPAAQGTWLLNGQGQPIERVDRTTTGGLADGPVRTAQISSNGQYVIFQTSADNIVPGSGTGPGLYVYHRSAP